MVATLAREVIALNEKISEVDRQIEASFRAHRQATIIASMPGIGNLLGAEILAAALIAWRPTPAWHRLPGTQARSAATVTARSDTTDVCNGPCSLPP